MFCSDPSPMLTRIFHSLGGLQQGGEHGVGINLRRPCELSGLIP